MQIIKREDTLIYEIEKDAKPLITVEPGEKFKVETNDHLAQSTLNLGDGPFKKNDIPGMDAVPIIANPVGGPIYVKGAEKGDVLAVHIEDIIPTDKACTSTLEGFGFLADKSGWDGCNEYRVNIADILPGPSGTTSDGTVRMTIDGRTWEWPCNPHIGTIFTAPEKGRGLPETLTTQGAWGGNVDCREICKGNTVYFNSFNEGGLLYLGDVHASQGDSELSGIAVETRADVILSIEVIKNKFVPGTMRIESPTSIIQIDSNTNSGGHMSAIGNAYIGMMKWLNEDYGFSKREAYLHMSCNSNVKGHIYQFLGSFFVCGVEFPKSYLKK